MRIRCNEMSINHCDIHYDPTVVGCLNDLCENQTTTINISVTIILILKLIIIGQLIIPINPFVQFLR